MCSFNECLMLSQNSIPLTGDQIAPDRPGVAINHSQSLSCILTVATAGVTFTELVSPISSRDRLTFSSSTPSVMLSSMMVTKTMCERCAPSNRRDWLMHVKSTLASKLPQNPDPVQGKHNSYLSNV